MAKKISALLIALLGSVMLLFGCNDPYKNFSISVSKTDVVLYLTDEGEPQEGLINSEYLMATVSGAGKGVSTDVTFAQYGTNGVNDIVSIEDVSKDGNKTLFNLKAQKPGRGIIYVNTQEGNLRAEINVTVYVPVKSIGFVTSNKAVKFGGEVELGKYLTFMPVGTNQTEVSFFIDDSTNAVVTNEQGNVTETSYAKIENGKLISKNASNYPIDDSNGLQYVNVYAVSNYNNQIKTQTVKIYVINVIDMSQVVLSTNSDLNSQPIVLVPSNGNVYDIILGKNSTIPFIFSRNLKIQVGSEFVTDKQYRISTSLDNAKSDVIGLVSLVSENDRYNYNGVADTYPYKTYQINQQVKNMENNVETFDINIDRVGFEGLFTITIKVRVTVKEFGEEIDVYGEDGENVTNSFASIYNVYGGNIVGTPLTLQINPNSTSYKINAKVINAPQVNGRDGFEIYLRNNSLVTPTTELNGGTTLYIKHNYSFSDLQTLITDPTQKNCPKLVLEYSYTMAPTSLTKGYKTYTVTSEVPLVALAGITDVGFQITSPIKINAITGKALGINDPEEGELYEIVIGTIGDQKVNLNTIISSIRAIAVNGEYDPNFDVFDNDYFTLEYRQVEDGFVNRLVLTPILQPVESNFDLVIKTKNNITKNIRVEIFVPIVYDYVDQGINQQSVRLEIFEAEESRGAIYDASNKTEYFIGVNDNGKITIIPSEEVEDTTIYNKSTTYSTQNAVTVAVNSSVGLNIYNYVVQTSGNDQTLRAINYNQNVTVIADRSYYSVEYKYINGIRTPFIKTGNIKTEAPVDVRIVLTGYDNIGNVVTMTKVLKLTIIKPITSIQLNPIDSTIYESTSVGYFNLGASKVELNLSLYPTNAVSSDEATKPNINFTLLNKDQVIKSYKGKRGNEIIDVEFTVGDFVELEVDKANNKCYVYAKIDKNAYNPNSNIDGAKSKFDLVHDNDISFSPDLFFNQIYKEGNLTAVVSATLQQYNKPIIASNVNVNVKYAKKVQNIIVSVDKEKGVYFDSRDYQISGNEIYGEGKEIVFDVEPSDAFNKNLIAFIADTSVAKIVSGVDSNNRIISNKIVVKPYVNAGRTILTFASEDSYTFNEETGIATPSTVNHIPIRVANGTKEYPFEISNAEEFLEIGRDINLGNNSYYYVLTDTISLRALESIGETLPPFKKFNGGLSGLFSYSINGISYSRQNYINDFELTKQMDVSSDKEYNIGLFEELSETAEIENLIFEGVKFDIKILNANNKNKIDIGVIAGRNYGSILNSRIAGVINVTSEAKNLNIGGMVGESFTYENYDITNMMLAGDIDITRKVTGVISYLPISTTSSSSSKVNSEVVINHIGTSGETDLNVNIGGIAGSVYTYAKHNITEIAFSETKTATVVNGYDFKNENENPVQPDVSVYSRDMGSSYNNLNVSATITSMDANKKLLPANVGGAFGYANSTYLNDITVAPNLMAKTNVGGLVGFLEHSIIDSVVVEFANAGQTGANTLSLIGEKNIGGLVGEGNNINIYYSYVRSYFNNSGINNEQYYGNIALKNNADIENKYVGGLVGYLNNSEISNQQANYGIILTGDINLDLTLKTLSEGSEEFDEYMFNGTFANGIFNSYFSADINLTFEKLTGNVYAGGLVGGTNLSTNAVNKTEQTTIVNSYVTGNIKNNEPKSTQVTTKSDLNLTHVGTTIEYKIGSLVENDGTIILSGEGNSLIRVQTEVTDNVIDTNYLETIITYTVYDNVGAFVGTETNSLELNREDISTDIVKSEDYAEDEDTGIQTAGTITTTIVKKNNFEFYKEFGYMVNVSLSYIGSNNYGGVAFTNSTKLLAKTLSITETRVEEISVSSTSLSVSSVEETIKTDLTKTESFINSETDAFNIVSVNTEAADYIPYTWLHYLGDIYTLNNGYPVLFKYKHNSGEILFKVLPTHINTNILNINQSFSNLSYIKQDESHVVLFNNQYISGKNYKNVNKYKLLLSEEDFSTQYVNMAQIMLDLPNLESVGIQADYASDLIITSSNVNVVRILNDLVIETLAEGEVTLRVSSKLDVSIFDEITILVVSGISDYNLYLSKNLTNDANLLMDDITHTQFIDNTSNYYATAINRDVEIVINSGVEDLETSIAGGYNGYYTVNPNVGVKLVVSSTNTGSAKLNDQVLENGKTYIFSSLAEFNLTGVSEGIISYELTPFIKLTNQNFGETLVSSNGDVTINNCLLINDLTKEYLFNVKPKAESLEIDKTNATIEPSQNIELNVSVVTSNFSLIGEEVVVNEDVIMLIKDTVTNQTVGSVSLLDENNGTNSSLINVEINNITAEKIYKDGVLQKVKAIFNLRLSFNTEAYKNRTGGVTYNLNDISYLLSFSPSTNIELNKQFNLKIVPKKVSDIKLKFYANSETSGSGSDAEFNPQEVETNFIVPSRMGLLKIELFPEFNEAEYVELTTTEQYKNYVSFNQKLAVMQGGENGYVINYQSVSGNTEYLPGFIGVKLVNQSMLANNSIIYNGNYYVQIGLDQNAPINSNIVFTAKAYKNVAGQKQEVYSKDITLTVQPLPSINLTVNGEHNSLINIGGKVELTVEANNFEGDVEFDVTSGKNNSLVVLDYDVNTNKYYIVAKDNAIAGDTITVIARVSRFINGIKETKDSTVTLNVVEYIVNSIRQQGAIKSASGNTLEMLNGTNQILNLIVDAKYNGNSDISTKINSFAQEASGRLNFNGTNDFINNWYIRNGNTDELLNFSNKYDNFNFLNKTLNDLNNTHYFAINAKRVSSSDVIGARINYYYNEYGIPTLCSGDVIGYRVYEQEFFFTLIIKDNSTYDHPNPISNVTEFMALQNETSGHFILVNDINLYDYVPFAANFSSLDGNGHIITINNFNTSSFTGGSDINCGLFTTISNNTVVKNVTLDVANLLVTKAEIKALNENGTTDADGNVTRNAKINLSNINSFNFGMLAGTNNGSLTNIKVINTKQTNANDSSSKYLFVYSTIGYISNGTLVDGNVGGIVGVNAGTISNSYIGLNDTYYSNQSNSEDLKALASEGSTRIQTYPFFIVGGKSIGAFVNKNAGIIANSYNLGVGLINSSTIFSGSKTAGFVVSNSSNGYIFNSMVEGIKTNSYRASSEIYLEATGNIGGFIYENSGRVENAYSNIAIKTNSGGSGGFVYDNLATGRVTNAYSTSPNAFNSKAHGQFTGINSKNKFNNAGELTSCFYLIYENEVANEDEPALAIRGKKVENSSSDEENKNPEGSKDNPFRYTGSFNGFSFATGTESNNIWTLGTDENFGPQLINIKKFNTFSHRTLTDTREENNTTIYDYIYDDDCQYGAMGTTNQVINPLLVNTAEEFVRFIINNSKTVPYNGDELYLFGDNEGVYYIRLINDLNFSEITLNNLIVDNKRISDIIFGGVLDGNGMSITGIKLTDLKQDSVHENFGLFSQVGLSDAQKEATGIGSEASQEKRINPSIQNVNITINGFAATQSVKVGAIAGSMYDTSLINVSLSAGENVEIVGRNLVGGFAGLIVNKPGIIINNVTTNNITVTASHRSNSVSEVSTLSGYGVALNNGNKIAFNSYNKDSRDSVEVLRNYSYAGSIAGVIDANNRPTEHSQGKTSVSIPEGDVKNHRSTPEENSISKITVQGGGFIAAEQAGGMFGYVGKNTHIKNSSYLLGVVTKDNGSSETVTPRVQQIRGYNYAGGIVGENYGMLEQVTVQHIADWQPDIDKDFVNNKTNKNVVNNLFGSEASVAIGGIAGFSDQSIIVDSFVKVGVINEKAKVAGGVIGIATRTNYLSHVYATGNVSASTVIGGLVGLYNKTGMHIIGTEDELKVTYVANNDSSSQTVEILPSAFRLSFDFAISANNWGEDVSVKLTENLQGYYDNGDGGYYNFSPRMPEIGNQAFSYGRLNIVKNEGTVTSVSKTETSVTDGDLNNITANNNLKYKYYIGSLVGKVEETTNADIKTNKIINNAALTTSVNAARKVSNVTTGFGKYYEFASVISTTLNSGKITKNNLRTPDGILDGFEDPGASNAEEFMNKFFNEALSALPTPEELNTGKQVVFDVVDYTNNIGNQFHLNSIFGQTGKNSNMFGGFAWDVVSLADIKPDSGSNVWMIDENLMPAYIIGIFSNFNEIKSVADLNTQIRIATSTKNQFYLLSENETADLADNKAYNFTNDASSTYQSNENLFSNAFEGTLIGNPNAGKNPLIVVTQLNNLSNIFNSIASATIQNVDFKIIIPDGYTSQLSKRDAMQTSFGLLAKTVKGSVLSNINVEIVFQGVNTNTSQVINNKFRNSFNNIGLLFGSVEDSTLNNINVKLTFEKGNATASPNITTDISTNIEDVKPDATKNLNFGILVGSGLRSILSNINIMSSNGNNNENFISLNENQKSGIVNVGTLAGLLKDCSVQNINQVQPNGDYNINGEIKVNNTFEGGANFDGGYNIGGLVGNLDASTMVNANYAGRVVVGNANNNSVSTKLNVGGIVGYANSSNVNVVMNNYYNTLNNTSPELKIINKNINVYNATTNLQTTVGGVAGFINNSTITGNNNNNITSGNASNINATVNGGTLDVGGIIGYARNSNNRNGILRAYNQGYIRAFNNSTTASNLNVGGVAGTIVGGKYEDVFNIGDIAIKTNNNYSVGGLFGKTSLSTSEKEGMINNFISYGDIYVNASVPNTNKFIGGVVGSITSNAIRFSNGYTLTRVFNAKNANDDDLFISNNGTFATNEFINGIGHIQSFDVAMFDKVFYIHEFFPYTNTKNLLNGTTEIGKVIISAKSDSVKFGGISYGNLIENDSSSNLLLAYLQTGNNSGNFSRLETTIKIPYLQNVIPVNVVYREMEANNIASSGNKLNPEIISSASNQTSVRKDILANKYYIINESGTSTLNKNYEFSFNDNTFNGVLINKSRKGVPSVSGFSGKVNNGILANFYVKVTNTTNLTGALLKVNNGNIINVVTTGYLELTSAPISDNGTLAMFVQTNYSNIVASGSMIMLAYNGNIKANSYSGFVTQNISNSTKSGSAYIKDCYSTSSFINTSATSNFVLNAPSAGLAYSNDGVIETSYYAGSYNPEKVGKNALVYAGSGKLINCYYDYDALSTEKDSSKYNLSQTISQPYDKARYVLTGDMLNSQFTDDALRTQTIVTSFENASVKYNYGYPTIINGIQINTLNNKNRFVIWHKGQISNLNKYDITGVNYEIVNNIDMNGVNKGISSNTTDIDFINPQDELKHNIYGNGYTISNLKITSKSENRVGWFIKIDGKEISNLTIKNAEVTNTKNIGDNGVGETYGVGIIAGFASGITLNDVKVIGTSKITAIDSNNVGGLIGYAKNGRILLNDSTTNVMVTVDANNGLNVGGVVGFAYNTEITSAKYSGRVTAKKQVGGIAGYVASSAKLKNCTVVSSSSIIANNANDISIATTIDSGIFKNNVSSKISIINNSIGSGSFAGGIVGRTSADSNALIEDCYPIGSSNGKVTISANSYSGGIVGGLFSTVRINYTVQTNIQYLDVVNNNNGIGAIALGGMVGYMSDSTTLENAGVGRVSINNSTIAYSGINLNFAVGGIVGFQNGGTIRYADSKNNVIYGSRLVGGAIGYQNRGSLANCEVYNNNLYYKSNKEMDEYDGDGKNLKAGASSNFNSVMAAVQGNDYNNYIGCVTINSTTSVNGYFTGTDTTDRLDELHGYFAVEYGGLDARTSKIDHGGDIKLYFGFITGGTNGSQSNITVNNGNIYGFTDISTTYVVHRNRDDFGGKNEWWWYLKKRKNTRTLNVSQNNGYYNFNNGTDNYNKFREYNEEFTYGNRTYKLIDMPCANHSLLAFISAGYSIAYDKGVDPITYIQNNMPGLFDGSINGCTYKNQVKESGKTLLRTLYGKHAYQGMSYAGYQTLKDWSSGEQHYKGGLTGNMTPSNLNDWGIGFSGTM